MIRYNILTAVSLNVMFINARRRLGFYFGVRCTYFISRRLQYVQNSFIPRVHALTNKFVAFSMINEAQYWKTGSFATHPDHLPKTSRVSRKPGNPTDDARSEREGI